MKPQQTIPLLTTLAPALAVAPPLLIGGAIVVGLIWLFQTKTRPPRLNWKSPRGQARKPERPHAS